MAGKQYEDLDHSTKCSQGHAWLQCSVPAFEQHVLLGPFASTGTLAGSTDHQASVKFGHDSLLKLSEMLRMGAAARDGCSWLHI